MRPAACLALSAAALWLGACRPSTPDGPAWPDAPTAGASEAFWATWGDGNAEVATYAATVSRYDSLRAASLVLVTVTEPVDRTTWVKDDSAAGNARLDVLKVNHMETFQTGLYPYSVMTSVFMPVADFGADLGGRFAPAKITLTAQEWCGHVWHGVWPGAGGFRSQMRSYFASEGETDRAVDAPAGTLYEDALVAQLRELDGPFAGGGDWSGQIVPALWQQRMAHRPLTPVAATIARADTTVAAPVRAGTDADGRTTDATPPGASGTPVAATRFRLAYDGLRGPYVRTIVVEKAAPRRILGWTTSRGERVRLVASRRVPYWRLNDPSDVRWRDSLALPALPALPAP